jgi:hypothetical protein
MTLEQWITINAVDTVTVNHEMALHSHHINKNSQVAIVYIRPIKTMTF